MFAYAEGYRSKVRLAHAIPAAQILLGRFIFLLAIAMHLLNSKAGSERRTGVLLVAPRRVLHQLERLTGLHPVVAFRGFDILSSHDRPSGPSASSFRNPW